MISRTALAMLLVATALPATAQTSTDATETQSRKMEYMSLDDWQVSPLYNRGWSADRFFGQPVISETSEEVIGDVEDLIIGPNGDVVALVAEVGGVLDIGDTHVSVPWNQVSLTGDGSAMVPVTLENADEFGFFARPSEQKLGQDVLSGLDDEPLGNRAWRASELIGDLVRVTNEEAQETRFVGYGYVQDLIVTEGQVVATVIDRNSGYGVPGRYAYPYYGYGYGWHPGNRYYNLPFDREEADRASEFDYERLGEN